VAKFPLGRILFTPGVLALEIDVLKYLKRHAQGDWGDVGPEDRQENEFSLENGFRLLLAYIIQMGRIWIITEADHSATAVLFPGAYRVSDAANLFKPQSNQKIKMD
jgi:hypothetical protein